MTDCKKSPLPPAPIDAGADANGDAPPPSYANATTTVGDGQIFSDLPPRPGARMSYSAPAQRSVYIARSDRQNWTSGLLSCFGDFASCCKACWCPCVSYGQTRHRLNHPGTPAPIFSAPCLGYWLSGSFIPGSQAVFGVLQRQELRMRLGIGEGEAGRLRVGRAGGDAGRERWFEDLKHARLFLEDTVTHVFCHCCALAQEDREVARWEAEEEEAMRAGREEEEGLLRPNGAEENV